MNKFILVLLLATSCFSLNIREIPEDDIYAAVVAVFKGLAQTDDAVCAAILVREKTTIMDIFREAEAAIDAGEDPYTVAFEAAMKLIAIDGLVTECNVLGLSSVIAKFQSKDGLVEIFQAVIDNVDEIYSYGESIRAAVESGDYDAAFQSLGHILSIALDYKVNLQ